MKKVLSLFLVGLMMVFCVNFAFADSFTCTKVTTLAIAIGYFDTYGNFNFINQNVNAIVGTIYSLDNIKVNYTQPQSITITEGLLALSPLSIDPEAFFTGFAVNYNNKTYKLNFIQNTLIANYININPQTDAVYAYYLIQGPLQGFYVVDSANNVLYNNTYSVSVKSSALSATNKDTTNFKLNAYSKNH